jgi:hypothetical protein
MIHTELQQLQRKMRSINETKIIFTSLQSEPRESQVQIVILNTAKGKEKKTTRLSKVGLDQRKYFATNQNGPRLGGA